MKRVLLLGSGAREHALAWKLAHSAKLGKLYAAPGNPGIARYAELVDLCLDRPANIATWSHKNRIDLVVIGPEAPLFAGVVDALTSFNIPAFGPTKAASRIESSKSWSKRLMRNYGVPYAHGQSFTDVASAIAWLDQHNGPIVVKADGPSLGKGVIMCPDIATAIEAVKELMIERRFGAFGDCVVLEESLVGQEVSAFALVDNTTVLPFGYACDYKRAFDYDRGPNTGGMGGFSLEPFVMPALDQVIQQQIFEPVAAALSAEGCPFRGFLYAGLMLTNDGPKVLEFNCRLGDPEAQLILPRLNTDLLQLMLSIVSGNIHRCYVDWHPLTTVAVVLASANYPDESTLGLPISNLHEAECVSNALVFQAGTVLENQQLVTAGGRILTTVGFHANTLAAHAAAYKSAALIQFEGCRYRNDIAGVLL